MKNILIIILTLAFVSVWNVTTIQAQDPAVTGAAFDEDPLPETSTTNLRISFANTGSGAIPNASIEVTVSFPNNWYGTDGVSVPTGAGAALFNWFYLGADVWRGTNNGVINGFSGGEIAFVVEGYNNTNGNTETTNINVQIVDNFGDFNDNAGNNNLAPVLEVGPAPLPVNLLRFDGVLKGAHVELDWKTASEENNDYFLVERSLDGRNFEEIGMVEGNGTTSDTHAYSLLDKNVKRLDSSILYYRLKQVDFDGEYTHSEIISIALDSKIAMEVFPNPSPGVLYFGSVEEIQYVTFYDESGKILMSGNVDTLFTGNVVDISSLKEGLLLVSIQMKDDSVINEKILLHRGK